MSSPDRDDKIAQFADFTGADPAKAAHYLQTCDGDLQQAITLFYDASNDLDFGGSNQANTSTPPAANTSSRPPQTSGGFDDDDPIQIDSDVEDDEAMARRLQEEMYGNTDAGGDTGVRAPMARTTETLVGGPDYGGAIAEQLFNRRRPPGHRPGIFTQGSVWDNTDNPRRDLARATGGASESSAKSNRLAEMYRPPFEIMSKLTWDQARDHGKSEEKWILVNVQDHAIFDCQILNRDIWKDPQIVETIKENFLFMQYSKDDPQASQYVNYYFHTNESSDAYPHIAIVDPRTGERVKTWSGPPAPKPMDFLQQLYEFLDRYSLNSDVRNPVATRKPEKAPVDVDRMTEEEMLEMAMQNSLANGTTSGPRDLDPDDLTRQNDKGKGKQKVEDPSAEASTPAVTVSPFASIASDKPHAEPANDPATTTRVQFRHSGGRLIRRFKLAEPVRTMYEWLKATPIEGKEDQEFELIAMGKNLIDSLDTTIGDAGLKNGTVMVEHLEG